ncbi:unnamed protein product [Closterium sp. NIES-54]
MPPHLRPYLCRPSWPCPVAALSQPCPAAAPVAVLTLTTGCGPALHPPMPRRPAETRRPAEPRRPTKPRHPIEPHCPDCAASAATAASDATATTAAPNATAAMASPTFLTIDAEGRAVDFDSLYDAVVARYSSPSTAALSCLMLPYPFPDFSAFATVADLITHLRNSDARYRAALPSEDHFLSLCPTELTVDLLEERLTAAKKSILAVGASRGDPRAPFFKGCSPVPLLPSVAFAAAVDLVGTAKVGAASAPSGRRRSRKGKGGKGGEGDGGGGGGGGRGGGGGDGGGGGGGGSGAFGGGGGGGGGSGGGGGGSSSGGGGGGGSGAGRGGAAQHGGFGGSQRQQQQPRSCETPSAQQLREWYAGRGRTGGVGPYTCVLRIGGRRGETCGLPHTLPRWGDLLMHNVAIFDLDFNAILAAMYAVTNGAEGDCYLCVPPDPGIEAAALSASASAAPGAGEFVAPVAGESALYGTAPTKALHIFTLDSGASRSFFCDSTKLTPLSRLDAVSLADPSGGPVLAHSSTVLPCHAALSGLLSGLHLPLFSTNLVSGADLQDAWADQFTPGGQRVTHCTCSRTGRHLATFTRRPGSSLYTLTTASPPVTASGQIAASGQVFSAASRSSPAFAPARVVLWHTRLSFGTTVLVTPPCLIFEGRQRAAPHSSEFPLTEAPLQTLHMDVKGEVTEVLVDWIRGTRRQLSERFGSDLPVLRLHSDRGGEFSSDLLRAFCRAEGIRQTFTLPASPQQNGIAERRIGMVMEMLEVLELVVLPGVVAGDPGAEGTGAISAVSGGAARPRPYYVPLLQQPASPLPGPSPYSGPTRGLTEQREPESRLASPESRPASPESRPELPVRTCRCVLRNRPPPVPGTHSLTLRPSTAPQRVSLPSPPASSLPALAEPETDSLRAASPNCQNIIAYLFV